MKTTQRHWDRMTMMPTSTLVHNITKYLQNLAEGSFCKRFTHHFPFMKSHWRAEADFKIMQLLFESEFHLPAHFDYVKYMKFVLQDVVISLANISTLHWLMLMAINFAWFVVLKVGDFATPDDHICLFDVDCAKKDAHRRLGGSPGPAPCGNSTGGYDKAYDIPYDETLTWVWVYVAIGWLVALLQALIVHIIHKKMQRVLEFNQAMDDNSVVQLIEELEHKVAQHDDKVAGQKTYAESPTAEVLIAGSKESSPETPHQKHIIDLTLSGSIHDGAPDTIMVFRKTGKDSNDVMSLRSYEILVFITQFLQLVIDFYLGVVASSLSLLRIMSVLLPVLTWLRLALQAFTSCTCV
jgi:hypothetical protein